jgi:hypothetical protein
MKNSRREILRAPDREIRAVVVAVLFLLLGFAILWFARAVLGIQGEAVLVALLLVPLLTYLVASGRLEGLGSAGGLEARLARIARDPAQPAADRIEPSALELQAVFNDGFAAIKQLRQDLSEARPIILVLELGKLDFYHVEPLLRYLESLSQFRNFKTVAFVEKDGQFVASMPSWAVLSLLSNPDSGEEFIEVLNKGHKAALFRFPGLVRETLGSQATNAEALRVMARQNLEAIVSVDENNRLRGVVEREQVLSRIVLALTG